MTLLDIDAPAPRDTRLGFWLLAGLVVLVAAGKPILFDTIDPDCFWHLRVAQQLHTDGIGPLVDRLSFASLQKPWTPYSWLAELGMEAVWKHGGWRAAVATQSILQGLFIGLIALSCRIPAAERRKDKRPPKRPFMTDPSTAGAFQSAVVTAFAAFVSLAYLSFRPVTAALALLALCALLLVRDRRSGERTRAVWLLVPITLLVVNMHLYAVFIPLWVFALLGGALWERQFAGPEHRGEADRRAMRYGMLMVATGLACLATPMLPGAIASALHYQYADPMVSMGAIEEMKPFYHGIAGKISATLVLTFSALALWNRDRVRVGEWIWLVISGVLLIRLGRFAPVFVIVAAPIFAKTLPRREGGILGSRLVCALMVVVLAGGLWRLAVSFPRSDMKMEAWLNRHGPTAPGYPCAAAGFVADRVTPTTGCIINEFSWGGYLEWRLGDNYRTLLDGRTQLFAPSFWRATYLGSEEQRQGFLANVRADAAVLPIRNSRFHDTLIALGWQPAYRDERAEVLVPPAKVAQEAGGKWPFATTLFDQ
ncbi:MAG: putative rane protein [Phycisphaerales bacterium]|nr:putative rane protein [Phycisphaerales bacterium]